MDFIDTPQSVEIMASSNRIFRELATCFKSHGSIPIQIRQALRMADFARLELPPEVSPGHSQPPALVTLQARA